MKEKDNRYSPNSQKIMVKDFSIKQMSMIANKVGFKLNSKAVLIENMLYFNKLSRHDCLISVL